jgi:hypothetical protein
MNKSDSYLMDRRGVLKGSAAALGGALLSGEPIEAGMELTLAGWAWPFVFRVTR